MRRLTVSVLTMTAFLGASASDFTSVVNRIVTNNPSIIAAEARVSADSLMSLTDNNLSDPEISLESLFGKGDDKYNVGIVQGVDWPGMYKARRARAEAAAMAAHASSEVMRAETRLQAGSLLSQMVASRKKLVLCQQVLSDLNRLLEIYRAEYAKGNVTVLDVNKLMIESAEYQQIVDDETLQITDAKAQLQELTSNIDIDALTADVDEFPVMNLADISVYRDAMLANSAQLRQLRAQSLVDEQDMHIASMSSRPGFSVGYRFSYEDNQVYNGFQLGMTLPVWSKRGKREAAQSAAAATALEQDAAVSALNARIDRDYKAASSLRQRISGYGKALSTTDNVGILRRAFDAGQISLTDYITDMRYFIEAEMRLVDLQQAYTDAMLSLEQYR